MSDFLQNQFGIDDIKLQDPQKQEVKPSIPAAENTTDSNKGFNMLGSQSYDLNKAAHPKACIFTFIFKAFAFIIYMIGGFIFSNIILFVIVTFFAAMDFWAVKNITGRLLVGLRWWTDFNAQGEQVMKFQSYDKKYKFNPVDKTFFWTSQIVCFLVWALLLVWKIISFGFFSFQGMLWILLILINLSVCSANLYAYYLCRKDYGQKLKSLKGVMAAKIVQNL